MRSELTLFSCRKRKEAMWPFIINICICWNSPARGCEGGGRESGGKLWERTKEWKGRELQKRKRTLRATGGSSLGCSEEPERGALVAYGWVLPGGWVPWPASIRSWPGGYGGGSVKGFHWLMWMSSLSAALLLGSIEWSPMACVNEFLACPSGATP